MAPVRSCSPVAARHRPRLLRLVAVVIVAVLAPSCFDLIKRKKRRFGSSCGTNTECESGVCYLGMCSMPCTSDLQCGDGICTANRCQPKDGDFDGDGLSNGDEKALGLGPTNPDSDGDGIRDGEEVGDPKKPKDTNGDGIIDALQSNKADADQDCIADAFDKQKGADPLPDSKTLCNQGICATNLSKVTLACAPGTLTYDAASGCVGCVCTAPGLVGFESPEKSCDFVDNDCDGLTDEALLYQGLALGEACTVVTAVCGKLEGLVACGAGGKTTCKTQTPGSLVETCNAIDDDCDGETDEGFLWQGKTAVGGSCGECGFQAAKCSGTAQPMNAPVVKCGVDGDPVCAGVPFAKGFAPVAVGMPQARHTWTATFAPGWKRLVLYGGAVPTAHAMVERADLWQLDLQPILNKQGPSPWQLATAQAPGTRTGAALAWDGAVDRLVLIGGTAIANNGATLPVAPAWSLSAGGTWTDVSALSDSDPQHVPPLPSPEGAVPNLGLARAFVLEQGTAVRFLAVFQPGHTVAKWVRLDSGTAWQGLKSNGNEVGGTVICAAVAADAKAGYVVDQDAKLHRVIVAPDGQTLTTEPVAMTGATDQLPQDLAQCVIDASGTLHVIGGRLANGGTGGHLTLKGLDTVAQPKSVVVAVETDDPGVEFAFKRAGGVAAWLPGLAGVAVGGGAVWTKAATAVATARPEVFVWLPATGKHTRADLEVPAPRIGGGGGWWPQQKWWCIGGGLQFDLPPGANGAARTVPALDVWCWSPSAANWQKLQINSPVLHAFGFGGVDAKGQRLVLAGGFVLNQGAGLNDIARLWEGRLQQTGKVDPNWIAQGAVTTVNLKTGKVDTVPASGAPALIAPTVAADRLRNRLLAFGGFDELGETDSFWALDLATLTWTDLVAPVDAAALVALNAQRAKASQAPVTKLPENQRPKRPTKRFGGLAVYDPALDVFALTAGSLRTKDGLVGKDVDTQAELTDCFSYLGNVVWVAPSLLPVPWQPYAVPTFLDVSQKPPQTQLLRPLFGGPAFVPVLFDALGGRAWLAVQESPRDASIDKDGNACPGLAAPQWTDTPVQLSLSFGNCGSLFAPKPEVKLDPTALSPLPAGSVMAAYIYVDALRQALVWGGLQGDGSLATGVWRLDQTCQP
jgi:hypothetical protein